jgi:flagellar basal-body rod modification protein FlgD
VSTLPSTSDRATITRGEFLNLLVSELTHQDPFKPIDNTDFAGQMAQIQSLQTSSELSSGFKDMSSAFQTMVLRQDMSAAGALIGREISGTTSAGAPIQGLVDSVKLDNGAVSLMVNGVAVPLGNVEEIKAAAAPQAQ